jgi:hypothetical protein
VCLEFLVFSFWAEEKEGEKKRSTEINEMPDRFA